MAALYDGSSEMGTGRGGEEESDADDTPRGADLVPPPPPPLSPPTPPSPPLSSASYTAEQSAADLHTGPTLSTESASSSTPERSRAPNVGRSAVAPQRAAGVTREPCVSVPRAKPTSAAETAAAGPADDPPEKLCRAAASQGLLTRPPNQMSSNASSPVASLATRTAPARSVRAQYAAALLPRGNTLSRQIAAPKLVGSSSTTIVSLSPKGMPWRGPLSMPRASSASALRACSSASSSVSVTTASSAESSALMRAA